MLNHRRRLHHSIRPGMDIHRNRIPESDVGDGPPTGHSMDSVPDFQTPLSVEALSTLGAGILEESSTAKLSSISSDSGYSSQAVPEQHTSGQYVASCSELSSTWVARPDNTSGDYSTNAYRCNTSAPRMPYRFQYVAGTPYTTGSVETSSCAHDTHRDSQIGDRSCSSFDHKVLVIEANNAMQEYTVLHESEHADQLDYYPANNVSYVCLWPGCDNSFRLAADLERHMPIHVLLFCRFESCNRSFFEKDFLDEHENAHGNSHYCCAFGGCHKTFAHQPELINHMLRHPII